ncbi:lactosylceramide 1,3-N-acetyl-beta-D-glucosaminyltransferase B-like [Tubulanus polymorphus]|uniref:lactosylceramide 1,3-N-acetyl-beta-D-glucosaminyltransferase B-like n=1 Tax=Tubulanus polymorphus TaxID=672921 RepID=UPI003DA26A0E
MRAGFHGNGSKRVTISFLLLIIVVFSLSTFVFYAFYMQNSDVNLYSNNNARRPAARKRIIASRDFNQIDVIRRIVPAAAEGDLARSDEGNKREVISVRRTRIRELTVEESLANIAEVQVEIDRLFKMAQSGLPQPHWYNYIGNDELKRRRAAVRDHKPKRSSPIPAEYFNNKPSSPWKPYGDRYVINNPSLCNVKDLYLMVVVMSEVGSYYVRKVIRETWGRLSVAYGREIRLAFIVGTETVANEYYSNQYLIVKEHFKNKDVIQRDFVDSYYNLTRKNVAALNWVSEFCSNARYTLRITENILLNPFKLIRLLESGRLRDRNLMFGNIRRSLVRVADGGAAEQQWPVLVGGKKYSLSADHYQSSGRIEWTNSLYPPYLSRPYILMTNDTVFKLSTIAERTPLMFPDYIYMSILAVKAGIVQTGRRDLFLDYKDGVNVYGGLIGNKSKAIFGHIPSGFNAGSKISQYWEEVYDAETDKLNCQYWFDKGQNIRESFPRELPYNENND